MFFIDLSNRLQAKFKHFDKKMATSAILEMLESIPTDEDQLNIKLETLTNHTDQKALLSLFHVKQYILENSNFECFYLKTLSVNTKVNIRMIKLAKVFSVKHFNRNGDVINVSISPYNEIELIEMATEILKSA